jgi:Kiwa protein KwaB-like
MAAADAISTDGAATLIVAWRGGRNAYCRVVKAGGNVIETLREYATVAAQRISEGDGRAYDPDDIQEQEQVYLSADREELLDTALLAQLERGASLPLVTTDDLRQQRIALYALLIGNNTSSRTIFIRKGSPVKLAMKGRLVTIFDQTLTRVVEPILAFDEKIDVILKQDAVWILDQRHFEGLFKESEAVLAKTAKWVEDLRDALPISDESKDWLRTRLRQNSVMRRKVQSILRSPYLPKLSMDILRQKMLAHDLDPDELIKDGALVFNKGTEASILLFLNEDLWTGDFSGEHYAAARKSRV